MIRKTIRLHFRSAFILPLFLLLSWNVGSFPASADDGPKGEDFSSLLYDSRDVMAGFDFTKAKGCGTREAINLFHSLFRTRAINLAGSSQDPSEVRTWNAVSGEPTEIRLAWFQRSDRGTAGSIQVWAKIGPLDCEDKPPTALYQAHIRFSIPVSGSPGAYTAGTPEEILVESICCRDKERSQLYVYSPTGEPLRREGTDFAPLPTARSGGAAGGGQPAPVVSGGAQAARPAPVETRPVQAPAPAPAPTPAPEPWSMENVCPECQDLKAVVDELKARVAALETELQQAEAEASDNRALRGRLDQEIERLTKRLAGEEGIGGSSTDPATGITRSSYDDGSGWVVVTEQRPGGPAVEVERYRRSSTKTIQDELVARKSERERLQQEAERMEAAQRRTQSALNDSRNRLAKALADLAECIDLCNRNRGNLTTYREQYPPVEPQNTVVAPPAASGGVGTQAGAAPVTESATPASPGVTETAVEKDSVTPNSDQTAAPAADSAAQTGQSARKTAMYEIDTRMDWRLGATLTYDQWGGWKDFKKETQSLKLGVEYDRRSDAARFAAESPPSRIFGLQQPFYDIKPGSPEWIIGTSVISIAFGAQPDPAMVGAAILNAGGSGVQVGEAIGTLYDIYENIYIQRGSLGLGGYRYDPDEDLYVWEEAADEAFRLMVDRRGAGDPISLDQAMDAVGQAAAAAGATEEEAWDLVDYYAEKWEYIEAHPQTRRFYGQRFRVRLSPELLKSLQDFTAPAQRPLTPSGGDYGLYLWENNLLRKVQEPLVPNDPLYPKKGGSGAGGAALKKGLGFILGMAGSPIGLNEEAKADDQWGLPSVGFLPRGTPGSAWDVADGAQPNIVVAVIDSGLDLSHKDGPQYLWTNTGEILGNGLDDDGNGYVDDVHGWNFIGESNDITDDYGHGTFVAGIIAARTHNGEGIAGIDPGARIMALKATDGNGSASALSIYRAIRYAVDNGARVINISLGEKGISRLEQLAINYAHAMGALVVVSAGNQAGDISAHGPPGARRAFSVGAVNIDGKHRDASNSGLNVAVSAPGESIYSLSAKQGKRDGRIMPLLPGDYHRLNGTSFSAPFVAGTAALIWSKRPDLSNEQVEDLITRTAKDLPPEGWDRKTGTGMLDAYGALTRDPAEAASAKIVEYRILRDGKRAIAVNLYGVVRGAVSEYRLEIGAGESPDRWQPLLGPLTQKVDYGLIGSIGGQHLVRGDTWSVRLTAVDASKRVWIQHIVIAAKDTAP